MKGVRAGVLQNIHDAHSADIGGHVGDGDGNAVEAQYDGGDEMALGLVISVVTNMAKIKIVVIVVIVLVTMMVKMKADSSFFSGSFQNLSPPRRPGHPCAPKTVPPAGRPGASGVPGPYLYHPSIWPAAQGP